MTHAITNAESAAEVHIDSFYAPGNLLRYGVPEDASFALQQAVRQFQFGGNVIQVPRGRYICTSPVQALSSDPQIFSQGITILGSGIGTVFELRFIDGYLFDVGTDSDNHFELGAHLEGFKIERGASGERIYNAGGIRLRRAWQPVLRKLWIKDLLGDMIYAPVRSGDADACNQGLIDRCRLEAGRSWAFNIDSAPGRNEGSYWTLRDSFIRGCGNASETTSGPASGGIRVRGAQQLSLENTVIAECENAGLYLAGGAGATTMVRLEGVQFENCKKRSLYSVMGVDNFIARGCGLYNNDEHAAIAGFEFNGDGEAGTGIVRNVSIDGLILRATPGNSPYTALKAFGQYAFNCQAGNVSVQSDGFPKPGQTLSEGFVMR